MRTARLLPLLLLAIVLAVVACGGGEEQAGGSGEPESGGEAISVDQDIEGAREVRAADFPQTRGRTLQELADRVRTGPEVGLATSVYTPGTNRLAFGVIDQEGGFVYGPSAVYVARSPSQPAEGPFPAPASGLVTEAPYRSQTSAEEGSSIAAIYAAEVPLPETGRYAVLTVTKLEDQLLGAGVDVQVQADSDIPEVGERPPRVDTETVESANGDLRAIETREPPDGMHEVSFAEVVGKKPVALLFSTPALCQSRVCGPVTDIAEQMRARYGDRMEFIHQEVFVENDLAKGLRPPLQAFNLKTEPWLFTVDRSGRVAARLEGSFGIEEFERAVKAAL